MLQDTLDAMNAHIINSMDGFTSENCAIEDVGVFDRMLSMEDDPRKCAIVGFGGAEKANQRSDFGSIIIEWMVLVNVFYLLWGSQEERLPKMHEAYNFVDTFIASIIADNTLGGQVMDTRLVEISEPMTYTRNEIGEYMMISMKWVITENL